MNSLDRDIEDIVEVKVKSNKVSNYFFPNINNIKSKLTEVISKDTLYKEFNKIYLVCLKDDIKYEDYFHQQLITEEQLEFINKSVTIIPVPFNILTDVMFNYLTIISASLFNTFKVKDKYNTICSANDDVLLCCLFRFKYNNINRYLNQFDGLISFLDLYNILLLNEYFNQTNQKYTIKNHQIQIINNIEESNYWTVYNNCKLNYTVKFKTNSFNLTINDKLKDKKVENVIKYLESLKDNSNYLEFLFKKQSYVDCSSGIYNDGYKLYNIPHNQLINTITTKHFNILFNKISVDGQYYLIMNCLISKDLCHLVVNNEYILKYITSNKIIKNGLSFLELYGQIIKYVSLYSFRLI